VSPAGGNFEEPVTQSTLKFVGAFLGLSRDRANARKFPSIDPLESWSKYESFIESGLIENAKSILFKAHEVEQMMKVVGEEGTSMEDFIVYLKGSLLDSVYLQQNAFDPVDAATSLERQKYVFTLIDEILRGEFQFDSKNTARSSFYELRQMCLDLNYTKWGSEECKAQEARVRAHFQPAVQTEHS
jgi:V/A-type H+-transporting ATPase subunit A